MRESVFQRQIIQYLRASGDYVFKVVGSPMQQRGTPDLLVCHQGLFVAIECKIPGENPSKLQEVEIRKVRQAGGAAGVLTSMDDLQGKSLNWIVQQWRG